ncbi:glycosyltransferase family 2 protein [Pseudoclavibacter sp. CFCC 13611]|uniref:glycosyltransferase family 2 protein n=1 Tax=Pseudoclavibacter sp. CFCC 13611 TaxID=2615178 RepID=UPI0013016D3A|nr:glycosyltransferase family 2 protein [Pseudoclavibacter sp. CFCC 13611]KAB1662777.1 glycosyltransferase family 2 protein [Pseudoclavibacter sp. CFCC 13611]
MKDAKLISVLIPVYNEAEVLQKLYSKLQNMAEGLNAYRFEFLFVDDGSADASMSIIRDLAATDARIAWVSLSRNFGKELAMLAGLDNVRGDATVVIDADLQDPPELIPRMIEQWERGFDDVYARRRTRSGESWLKKSTSKLYYRILQRTTRVQLQMDTGDFRLLDRKCVEALRQLRESERYTKGMFSWIGFRKVEVVYDRPARQGGITKWNYGQLVHLAIDGLTSCTTAPLRFSSFMGAVISIAAFAYLLVIVVRTLMWGNTAVGYPSLMAVMLFLGGVQLLSLGIIGEYIGRIFMESKRRPAYLVQSMHESRPE